MVQIHSENDDLCVGLVTKVCYVGNTTTSVRLFRNEANSDDRHFHR